MPTGTRPEQPVGTARVAMSGLFKACKWTRVFYLDITGSGVTVNDLKDLADFIATTWHTTTMSQLTSDTTLNQVSIRYVPSLGNELIYVGSYSYTATGTGTSVDDGSACYVVDYVISASYRGGHPRAYIPGVDGGHVSDGKTIDSAKLSNIVSEENNFRNDLNAETTTNITGVTMGCIHWQSANAWLSPPVFRPFTSVKAGKNYRLGSQRRRLLS